MTAVFAVFAVFAASTMIFANLDLDWSAIAVLLVLLPLLAGAFAYLRKHDIDGLRDEEVKGLQGLLDLRDRQLEELKARVAVLEGQVAVLSSDFARTLAREVVRAVRDVDQLR